MSRSDRLYALIGTLRDGAVHRAEDLAQRHNVSLRTIYRDMETLQASGVAVTGTRGTGYRAEHSTPLPALSLSDAEMEALQLGIAIVSQATDPDLQMAANSLGAKIDAALTTGPAPPDWMLATYPFADAARAFAHLAPLRAAIRGRQKLRLTHNDTQNSAPPQRRSETLRPLQLEHWGRIWLLSGWSEDSTAFTTLRVDLIEQVSPLPELFVDEPGKTLTDFLQSQPQGIS